MNAKALAIKLKYKWRGSVEWQMTSSELRAYAKSLHGVDVELHTYGSCFDDVFNGGGGSILVGRYCSFAGNVRYFGANHPTERAVMSPLLYNPTFTGVSDYDVERSGLVIGNDVWVGYGSIITSGCNRIGNGAVIGAGSIVTHDVEPYSIVTGAPARERRKRFDGETIAALEDSRWWELEPGELMMLVEDAYEPRRFAEKALQMRVQGEAGRVS